MNNKQNLTNVWIQKSYDISNLLVTSDLIRKMTDVFWSDIMETLDPNQYVSILAILDYNNSPKTLGKVNTVKYSDKEELLSTLINVLRIKSDQYHTESISSISFKYKLTKNKLQESIIHRVKTPEEFKLTSSNLFGYDLPSTMNFLLWGKIKSQNGNNFVIEFVKEDTVYEYHITQINSKINIVYIICKDRELLKFTDTSVADFDNFKRSLNNYTYFYQNSKIACISCKEKVSFIEPIPKANDYEFKLITLDIETRLIGKKMIPYCICFYTRDKDPIGKASSYYLSDYNSVDDMLNACMLDLFSDENNGSIIYIHNLSKFDSVFLLRILSLLKINKGWKDNMALKIIKRDSSIIGIKVKHRYLDQETNKYITFDFEFRDSYLTLPFSLKTLGVTYECENKKGIFPYGFVGSEINLNYVGNVPEFKYFSDTTPKVYDNYASKFTNNNWSLKNETIKYCIQDCKALFDIMYNFNRDIFSSHGVTLEKFPTLPSLAFGIFRSSYMPANLIPKLVGKTHDFIKKSYTGGAVDVYNVRPIQPPFLRVPPPPIPPPPIP